MSNIYTGKVKWFDPKKGFGVINIESENDLIVNEIFIHYNDIIVKKGIRACLYENETVQFNVDEIIKNDTRKWIAKNVRSVKDKLKCEETQNNKFNKKRHIKNTESFEPDHSNPDMRIIIGNNNKYNKEIETRDIILSNNLFCQDENLEIYNSLLEEIKQTNIDEDKLWKLWHGDTHLIADDHLEWKKKCPTFNKLIEKIEKYFEMDIKASRFNFYRDSSDWKPFHHDAAAVKPDKSLTQNFTVGISFGAERDICFEHAKTKQKISFPLSNGTLYAFSKDINIEWKHGIPQISPEKSHSNGRISIIVWGKVKMKF